MVAAIAQHAQQSHSKKNHSLHEIIMLVRFSSDIKY